MWWSEEQRHTGNCPLFKSIVVVTCEVVSGHGGFKTELELTMLKRLKEPVKARNREGGSTHVLPGHTGFRITMTGGREVRTDVYHDCFSSHVMHRISSARNTDTRLSYNALLHFRFFSLVSEAEESPDLRHPQCSR